MAQCAMADLITVPFLSGDAIYRELYEAQRLDGRENEVQAP